jgi:putative mRNA 3-end processing factor
VGNEGALGIEVDECGLRLRALDLWLDPTRPARAAFLSHAHGARALAGGHVLASPETLALAGALSPQAGAADAQALDWDGGVELPIDRAFGGGTARLSIAPAGHALGAAQLVIDHPRGRLVYTGDFGAEPDVTHAAGVPVPCDEVIVTSTFGLPIFRFEPLAQTRAAVAAWCADRIASDTTPVVLAQNPGPAQSIACELVARGIRTALNEEVRQASNAYEALGVTIGPTLAWGAGVRGLAIVAPASARAAELRARARTEVAYP